MGREGIVQLAYVVEDIESAVREWTGVRRAGPFFQIDMTVPDGFYRGRSATIAYRVAFGYLGAMNVELIAQSDPASSVYREMLDSRGPGFHHYMIDSEDYAETLERYASIGVLPAYEAELKGSGPWAYLDALGREGCFIEVYSMSESTRAVWRRMHEIHLHWDGARPLRDLAELS